LQEAISRLSELLIQVVFVHIENLHSEIMVLQLNSFCFCRLTAGMSCGHSRELSPTDNDNPIRQEWDVKQDNFTNTLWNGHSRLYRQLHAVLGGGQAEQQVSQ